MEEQKLNQSAGSTRKNIVIKSNHLTVHDKSLQEDLEYQIKFEELSFEIVKKTVKSANLPFYAFLGFFSLNGYLLISSFFEHSPVSEKVIWIFGAAFFGALAFYAFTLRNKNTIYLTGGQKVLELLAAKPDTETVTHFIDSVHTAMRKYYKEKYTKFDDDATYEAKIATLKWLRSIEVITEQEYANLNSGYKTESIIGFKRNDELN